MNGYLKLYFLIILIICSLTDVISFAQDLTSQQVNLNIVDRLARFEEGQKAIISEMQTRFEAITTEMNTRFEAITTEMNTRFEAVEERISSMQREMDQRFEAVDKRFEAVDKRFEAMLREMNQRFDLVDKRFEAMLREMNQRFESVDKRMDQLGNYNIAMITTFLALIFYSIWDRKTAFEKAFEKAHDKFEQLIVEHMGKQIDIAPINTISPDRPEMQDQISPSNTKNEPKQLISINNQEKINQIIAVMKQMSNQSPEMRNMMQSAQLI
ncbi:conserved hypothetical protein, membrane [Candidatus Magnetomorum sp. HK-1]|nr:conserved hypothetical protein, membrane [Candidatus Magnetomorum sp. HK-1]